MRIRTCDPLEPRRCDEVGEVGDGPATQPNDHVGPGEPHAAQRRPQPGCDRRALGVLGIRNDGQEPIATALAAQPGLAQTGYAYNATMVAADPWYLSRSNCPI